MAGTSCQLPRSGVTFSRDREHGRRPCSNRFPLKLQRKQACSLPFPTVLPARLTAPIPATKLVQVSHKQHLLFRPNHPAPSLRRTKGMPAASSPTVRRLGANTPTPSFDRYQKSLSSNNWYRAKGRPHFSCGRRPKTDCFHVGKEGDGSVRHLAPTCHTSPP